MAKNMDRPRTYRSMALPIIALTLALWMACTGLLTWCVASDMLVQMQEQMRVFLNSNVSYSRGNADESELPGQLEQNMIRKLGYPYYVMDLDRLLPIVHPQPLQSRLDSDDWLWGKWDLQYGFEAAVAYYGENDVPLIRTGDHLTFTYTTEENWLSGNDTAVGMGYAVLDGLPGGAELADRMLTNRPIGSQSTDMFFPLLRLTGYFEGSEFHPTSIDRGWYFVVGEFATDISRLIQLDNTNRVEWETIFALPVPEGKEQETIYAWDAGGFNCTPKKVTVNGNSFASLSELLVKSKDPACFTPSYCKTGLLESVLIEERTYEDAYGPYTIALAVRCKPLQYAALRLIWVYLISFAVTALCLLLVLRRLKYRVAAPIETMARSVWYGYTVTPTAKYKELRELETYFSEAQQTLSENKAELQQLRTALDYARDAEEKRKQLISNITHELKTPLAIIHSYCECLQEDIPEETREQYLQTVLEETEKMDAMVLQMLELSRLEAGRIRLASDPVSLLDITRNVCDKMSHLFMQRNLTVNFVYAEEFTVTADEARMEQVITNLLSNAQKYTSEGGEVRIYIYRSQGRAHYNIENTAQHLPEEALEKVWDSFYRVDKSRNTPGTGLGLSLVKSIISLHGGTCSVRNTDMGNGEQGVQFGFVLQ